MRGCCVAVSGRFGEEGEGAVILGFARLAPAGFPSRMRPVLGGVEKSMAVGGILLMGAVMLREWFLICSGASCELPPRLNGRGLLRGLFLWLMASWFKFPLAFCGQIK